MCFTVAVSGDLGDEGHINLQDEISKSRSSSPISLANYVQADALCRRKVVCPDIQVTQAESKVVFITSQQQSI